MLEDMRDEERRAWETTTDCNCGLQGGAARSNNRRNEPHFGCRTKILRASTWTAAVLAAAGRQVAATHCRENVIRIQTGNWRQKIRSEACRHPNTHRATRGNAARAHRCETIYEPFFCSSELASFTACSNPFQNGFTVASIYGLHTVSYHELS